MPAHHVLPARRARLCRFAVALSALVALSCIRSVSASALCDAAKPALGACHASVSSQACCDAQAAWNAAYCHCPGMQSYYTSSLLSSFQQILTACGGTPITGSACPVSTPGAAPPSAPPAPAVTSVTAVWAYAVLVDASTIAVSCKFSVNASAVTQLALRWSADPTFPASATTTIRPDPAASFVASGVNAGSFLANDTSSSGRLVYYSVLGNTATVNGTWSAAVATVNGIGALFAAPNGAAAPSCGTFTTPCGAIADVLATPASPILLLPGNFSGPGNCGLNMAGKSRSVASLAGSAATLQDCLGMDRGWLFNTSESIAANASVSGITIVNGHASGGAGMLFVSAAAAVRDVVFLYCVSDSSSGAIGSAQRSAGGGVSLYNSNATFNNVTFSGNLAGATGGGAVFAEMNSNATFTNCLVLNNTHFAPAKGGGFKLVSGSSPRLINVTFVGNYGFFAGGLYTEFGSPVLTNVTIANNTARYGGGIVSSASSQLQCTGCVITGNQAEQFGGGILGGGGISYPSFTNSIISSNVANEDGGGFYLSSITYATLQGCSVTGNSAGLSGGGWWLSQKSTLLLQTSDVSSNSAGTNGGGGWCSDAAATVQQTTMTLNGATGLGGAAFVYSGCVFQATGVDLRGNGAAGGGGVAVSTGGNASLVASVIRSNLAASMGGGAYLLDSSDSGFSAPPSLLMSSCLLDSNRAILDGGAVALVAGAATFSGGAVSSNAAGGDGGGVSVKGTATATLASVVLLGNQAAQFGGAVILSDDSGASLAISGGLIAGNTAGTGGGAVALHSPAFTLDTATLADNSADRGGGVHLATDFSVSLNACAMYPGCTSPLHELNFTGNVARAGSSIFWSRANSLSAPMDCVACITDWPPRTNEFATEPLSLAYGIQLPDSVITNTVVSPWSVQLLDWYQNVAAGADNYACTVITSGAAANSTSSLATELVVLHGDAAATDGVAEYTELMTQGKVGVTYDIDVQCTTSDSGTLPLPLLHGNITMGPCPPGTQVTVDMRFCEPCKGDDFNLVAGGVCRPCPMGAKCTEGYRIEALPDWWRAANTSAILFSCPLHSSCQSGPDAGDHACALGYAGPVCAICSPGFYPWGHECKKCTTDFRWVMPVAGFFAACCFFAALFLLPVRPENSDPAVRVKIALTLLQVLGLIKDYAVRWRPQFLVASMSYFDVLNIGVEMTAPSCGDQPVDFYSAYVTTMLLPLGALVLCGSMWLVHHVVIDKLLSRERLVPLKLAGRIILPAAPAMTDAQKEKAFHAFKIRCLKNCFWLLMLLYPGVCKKVMQLYGTRSLEGGTFLRADYGIRTRDTAFNRIIGYQRYASAGILMCFLYPCGIPLLFALLMRRERQRKIGEGEDFLDSYIGFVAAGYSLKSSQAMYWELLEMFRKLAMAAIGVFAVDGAFNAAVTPDISGALAPVVQPFLGQLITVLSLALLLWYRPYERAVHNIVQAISLVVTWLCLLVGESLFNVASTTGAITPMRQESIGVWLGVCLLLVVFSVVLWAVHGTARDMFAAVKKIMRVVIERSSSQVAPVSLLEKGTSYGDSKLDIDAPEDGAHACALADVDLSRKPRNADGDQYAVLRAPRVSDGERFAPTPPGSHPLV